MPEILVISDTHLRDASRLPDAVLKAAHRADHIVHAGDHSSLEVLRVLEQFAPVTAVRGNIEEAEVAGGLPEAATVAVDGVSVGVVHDAGPGSGRERRLLERFPGCDVIVYGHSHMPEAVRTRSGPWVLNPGSPTQRRRAPFHSIGWISASGRSGARRLGDSVACEIVDIDEA